MSLWVPAAAQAERRCTLSAAVVRTPGRYPESERTLRELGAWPRFFVPSGYHENPGVLCGPP